MGIAIFTASRVFAPVQSLLHWLMPEPEPVACTLRAPYVPAAVLPQACPAVARRAPRAVRVVRVVDVGHASCNAGRMVISGRMADVCAELDRLAACEAATLH